MPIAASVSFSYVRCRVVKVAPRPSARASASSAATPCGPRSPFSKNAAAKELARTVMAVGFVGAMVNGTTAGKFLDDSSYDGILAAAEELDVPIYIHPHIPPAAVREAYFSGLPEGAGRVLETAGWGWHSEVAVHVLRMVVAGTLDKHPKLKLISGHMGEMLPMMLDRIDAWIAEGVVGGARW